MAFSEEYGIKDVALSGGTFQNLYLLNRTTETLMPSGMKVYVNQKVPCNDGGISLGQAYLIRERLKKCGDEECGVRNMKQMLEELHMLAKGIGRPLKLMEVCGTHTVEIFRHGIRDVIPKNITLLSGPGCPVCVTSVQDVDAAIAIARTRV